MGRLLSPGLGELADRLTILELKLGHAPAEAPTDHFLEERTRVQMLVDRLLEGCPSRELARREMLRLKMINSIIWELEDEMEKCAHSNVLETDAHFVACLGITIWHRNRERNQLVGQLNELDGAPPRPEKLG